MIGSSRLSYRRLTAESVGTFVELCRDEHVRRYLLDGAIVDRAWAEAEVERSEELFEELGVGMWLAELAGKAVGFCGFRRFAELTPEPQLLYALPQRYTGRGLGSEMAAALIAHVRGLGWKRCIAAVDAPNAASLRVLDKRGFFCAGHVPGPFGDTLLFERFEGEAPVRIAHPVGSRFELTIASTWDGAAADERVCVALELRADELAVAVDAPFFGDPPPAGRIGSTSRLWEHEVVELMLLGADDRYLEVELSPHGHYLVLLLHRTRNVVHQGMVMHHRAAIDRGRWRGEARVPLAWVPPGCDRLNGYAIHGVGSARRYLAWRPTGGERPDFHRLDRFAPFPASRR